MRKLIGICVGFLALLSSASSYAQDASREVNITAGSTAGWIPSEELEDQAKEAFERYFRLLDAQDYGVAHSMMGSGLQGMLPLDRFEEQERTARQNWGRTVSREITKITWTKDASNTPKPGIYVALDMTARFTKVDRHCGYMILHKAPDADSFVIARTQQSVLENQTAASIAQTSSPLQMELVWRIVARGCPNYQPPELPDTISDGIEFSSFAEAKASLVNRSDVETKLERGWTIIADKTNLAVWSFSPLGDPTHPSVLKRWVESTGPETSEMSMGLLCEAEKRLCDGLFEEMALANGFIPVTTEQ
ncbi:DUF4019 domain-containing protein [uncultured Erythrobacter sp.]|uniref:DUF4019 domain-containing protein n=1 Tax=uncultured Erythrobacter sp. TaxID=263913 RepID=UPI0026203BC0|nr:DUF4019 domain-containing protein [uncultured Erythrobacter sp.]